MSNKQNILPIITLVLVVILGGIVLSRKVVEQKLGGVESYSPYQVFNGIQHWYATASLTTGTSTPCRLQSPNASSTLIFGEVRFNTASSAQAIMVDLARDGASTTNAVLGATTAGGGYATTSKIGLSQNITAGFQATILATSSIPSMVGGQAASTTNPIMANVLFAPNDWFVVKVAAPDAPAALHGNSAGFVPVGTCQAEWIIN